MGCEKLFVSVLARHSLGGKAKPVGRRSRSLTEQHSSSQLIALGEAPPERLQAALFLWTPAPFEGSEHVNGWLLGKHTDSGVPISQGDAARV